jgi:hypothetical protein
MIAAFKHDRFLLQTMSCFTPETICGFNGQSLPISMPSVRIVLSQPTRSRHQRNTMIKLPTRLVTRVHVL